MHDKMLTACFAAACLVSARAMAGADIRRELSAALVTPAPGGIVQHDPQDFQALPKFPAYLD